MSVAGFSNPDESLASLQNCAQEIAEENSTIPEICKHDFPLNTSWDIYTTRPEATDWADKLVKIASFDTVKGFWAIYQHLKLPSFLRYHHDYYVFRRYVDFSRFLLKKICKYKFIFINNY